MNFNQSSISYLLHQFAMNYQTINWYMQFIFVSPRKKHWYSIENWSSLFKTVKNWTKWVLKLCGTSILPSQEIWPSTTWICAISASGRMQESWFQEFLILYCHLKENNKRLRVTILEILISKIKQTKVWLFSIPCDVNR